MKLSEAACKIAMQYPIERISFCDMIYMSEADALKFRIIINTSMTSFIASYNIVDKEDAFGKATISFEVIYEDRSLAKRLANNANPAKALYDIFENINKRSKRLFPDWTDGFANKSQFDELVGTQNINLACYDTETKTLIIDFDWYM